jgi:serine/threonine protein kinase
MELGHQPAHNLRELEVLQSLLPGDRHDSFTLVRPLHEGGRVWLATDPGGLSHVLKFPPLDAAEDEQRREAFLRELWHAARMDSPDFVRAHVPLEGSLRYYVLEYIQAPTLREVLKQGPLRVEEGIELARFLLRAAQYLLSRDHVHGDIKPENILVLRGADGIAFRMIDFGSTAGVLTVHSRAGTPSYLAPERFEGAAVSERTELFSIGVTLHEALTRCLPYGEIERFQTPSFDRPPRRPSQRNRAIPGWLECVILRSLSVDIAARYQTFSEMGYELDNPDKVAPFHVHGEPLRLRNPVLFYKLLSGVLFACVLVLSWLLLRR